MKFSYSEYVPIFKALSDETRLKIVDMLSCGELCACKILEKFNITQPTLSYHMKILMESRLVTGRKQGSWVHYKLCEDKFIQVSEFLTYIANTKENCICEDEGNKKI